MSNDNDRVNIYNPDGSKRDVGEVVREVHHQLGYHCSETLMRVLWPYLLPEEELTDAMFRMTMVLHGGIADSMGSHCGALMVPILLIGAKYGRENIHGDDRYAPSLAREFWQRFLEDFGTSNCTALKRDQPPTGEAPTICGCLMVRSARLLLEYIDEIEKNPPDKEELYAFRLDRSNEPCHEQIKPMKSSTEVRAEQRKKNQGK